MTKKSIYFGTLLLTALALGSCASDDTATDKTAGKETPKTGTVFSSETEPATRTSATYTGSGLDFYWTANDKIWVKDDGGNYNQSSEDDIASRIAAVPGSTTTAKAKFWVNGTYTGSTHKVRYTGRNGVSDKVTIKASQTQNTPNDAAHIADDGDFGVADATGSGKYSFTLNHKAAYVTFMPYTAQGVIAGAKLQKIRIYTNNTSDQLAGTFDLADNGTLSNATATSNSVELNVNNFTIPSVSTYATNGATMIVKPGTYTNLTIEYTLHDAGSNVTGTVKKTYPSVTFDAGKNTPVRTDLKVKEYRGDKYYMWDAQQNYWYGHEWNSTDPWQPVLNNQSNSNYPKSATADPDRWYNESGSGGGSRYDAQTALFKTLPNANELIWYATKGDPRWDADMLWATMGHLYKGGMWFLKKDKIASKNHKNVTDLADAAPDGADYRGLGDPSGAWNITNNTLNPNQLSNNEIVDYFFLPAIGQYFNGNISDLGFFGAYWSSSAGAYHNNWGFGMSFLSNSVTIRDCFARHDGFRVQPFE